jgi:hypothetical protein
MRFFCIIFQLVFFYSFGFAQQADGVAELQKIRAYYAGSELKHAIGQMVLKNTTTGKQVDKVDFEYWAKDNQVFTKMNYIEILNNNGFYVMVNNKAKSIYARAQSDMPQKASVGFFDPEQLNALLNTKGANAVISKDAAGNNKLLMTGLKNTRFTSFAITYGADYKIIGIDAAVNPEPSSNNKLTLTVKYSLTEKTVVTTEPTIFSEAKYITKNNKGIYNYTATYQNYQKL